MAERQKILIVEDDLDLAEMLTAYFRMQGYEVLTAAWGEDALRVTREDLPDVVLLDIRLPDIDGYEVCRQLRRQRRTGSLPVIFLTEKRDRADRLEGLELGAVDYITKPFDVQELRLRVHNALERARLPNLVNAVTGLPEGTVVNERLSELLGAQGWALLVVTIRGLDAFRETYGFLASDDVLRAAAVMLTDALREDGAPSDFLGHLAAEDFVLVTGESRVQKLRQRMQAQLSQSIALFYPEQDRAAARQANGLQLLTGVLTAAAGQSFDLNGLKTAALRSRAA
jgi:PleD family two-component response regulator